MACLPDARTDTRVVEHECAGVSWGPGGSFLVFVLRPALEKGVSLARESGLGALSAESGHSEPAIDVRRGTRHTASTGDAVSKIYSCPTIKAIEALMGLDGTG